MTAIVDHAITVLGTCCLVFIAVCVVIATLRAFYRGFMHGGDLEELREAVDKMKSEQVKLVAEVKVLRDAVDQRTVLVDPMRH